MNDESGQSLDGGKLDKENSAKGTAAELWALTQLSLPNFIALLSQQAIFVASLSFAGGIGNNQLAAVGLGIDLFFNISYFCSFGLLCAMDTQIPRFAGAKMEDKIVQCVSASMVACAVCSTVITVVYLLSNRFLLLIHVDPTIAALVRQFLVGMIFGMPAFLVFTALSKLLQGLNSTLPVMVVTVTSVPLHVALTSCLVNRTILGALVGDGWEVFALGLGVSATRAIQCGGLAVFTCLHPRFRIGIPFLSPKKIIWSNDIACEFLRLGIPSSILLSAEIFSYEVMVLLAQYISVITLVAQTSVMNIYVAIVQIPVSLSQAMAVRIGFNIGTRSSQGVNLSLRTSLLTAVCIQVFLAATVGTFLPTFMQIFTRNKLVLETIPEIRPYFMFVVISDGMQNIFLGVTRGFGWTGLSMVFAMIGYFVFALPIATTLTFGTKLGFVGIWIGLSTGTCITLLCLALLVLRLHARLMGMLRMSSTGPRGGSGALMVELVEVHAQDVIH